MRNTISDDERDIISANETKVSAAVALDNIRYAFTSTYFKTLVYALICTLPLIIIGYVVGLTSPDNGLTITTSAYALITPIAAIYGFYSINKKLLYRKITESDWTYRNCGKFAYVDTARGIIYRAAFALVFCFAFITIITGQMVNPDSILSLVIMSILHTALFLFVALRFFRAMLLYPGEKSNKQNHEKSVNTPDYYAYPDGDIRNNSGPHSPNGIPFHNHMKNSV